MRLVLCMTIVGTGVAVGAGLASRLNERTRLLQAFITMIEEAALRMTYTGEPLAVLFGGNFAQFVFTENQPFADQFRAMTRQYRDVLNEGDIRLLDDFTQGLGASDTECQQRHMRLYVSLLSERLSEAKADAERRSRLCRILPLSVAAAAAVLLL